jgi:taurine dioxygenase
MDVIPLTTAIGAEVRGVDARQPLSESTFADLHAALMEHLVLFLRGQDVSEEEQLLFAANFGPPVSASMTRDRDIEPRYFVTLEDSVDSPPIKANGWHTDLPGVAQPPDFAVLSMRDTPPVGGDTLWVSLYTVYDSLSPTFQDVIADLLVEYDLGVTRAAIAEMHGLDHLRELEANLVIPQHPLVRVHPVTGRPSLYLSVDRMRGIAGMEPAESDVLLGFLASRLDDPNFSCRWHYQHHDLVIWDERCTNHRALTDHYPQYRRIRRCFAGESLPLGVGARM